MNERMHKQATTTKKSKKTMSYSTFHIFLPLTNNLGRIVKHFAVQEHTLDKAQVGVVGISRCSHDPGGSLTLPLYREPKAKHSLGLKLTSSLTFRNG